MRKSLSLIFFSFYFFRYFHKPNIIKIWKWINKYMNKKNMHTRAWKEFSDANADSVPHSDSSNANFRLEMKKIWLQWLDSTQVWRRKWKENGKGLFINQENSFLLLLVGKVSLKCKPRTCLHFDTYKENANIWLLLLWSYFPGSELFGRMENFVGKLIHVG